MKAYTTSRRSQKNETTIGAVRRITIWNSPAVPSALLTAALLVAALAFTVEVGGIVGLLALWLGGIGGVFAFPLVVVRAVTFALRVVER